MILHNSGLFSILVGNKKPPHGGAVNISRQTHGIKVNHLPHDITSEQVTAYFEPYGSIANVSLKEGENERYAFVNFLSKSCALTAVERMNNTVINGKRINCKAQGGRSGSVGEYAIKVTCVSKSTTPESLSNVFSFGNSDLISSVNIIPCGAANAFNYAYVNYFSARDAQKATAGLDQWKLDGSCIRVKLSSRAYSYPAYQLTTVFSFA